MVCSDLSCSLLSSPLPLFSTRFISAVRKLSTGKHQIESSFETHPSKLDFEGKWNLDVYFSLRFNEISSDIESVLGVDRMGEHGILASTPASPSHASGGYIYKASTAVVEGMQQCLRSSSFLSPLAGKFLQLQIQIIHRYQAWVKANIATPVGPKIQPHMLLCVLNDINMFRETCTGNQLKLLRGVSQSTERSLANLVTFHECNGQ